VSCVTSECSSLNLSYILFSQILSLQGAELALLKALQQSSYVTKNASQADFFFVPAQPYCMQCKLHSSAAIGYRHLFPFHSFNFSSYQFGRIAYRGHKCGTTMFFKTVYWRPKPHGYWKYWVSLEDPGGSCNYGSYAWDMPVKFEYFLNVGVLNPN
jgi:hypothetical protein